MKIGVLVKRVPDTASKIDVKSDKSGIEEGGLKFVMSPYDEFAVEAAIQAKDKLPGSETFVITLGNDAAVDVLRTALAMGIDKAIHIDTEGKPFDSFLTAKALAKAIQNAGIELVFCGKQATDADNGQVAPMVAEFLNIPQVMIVEKFEIQEDKKSALATRRMSGGAKEIYQVAFPAVIGCEKGLNTPRYASLPGIMKAKSKPIEKIKAQTLVDGATPLIQFVNYQPPTERKAGKMLAGEATDQARELVKLLREEAKAI